MSVAGNTSGDIAYFDAVFAQIATLTTVRPGGKRGRQRYVTANMTVPTGYFGGVLRNVDNQTDPKNFIIGYIDGAGKAYLEKVVATGHGERH